MNRWTPVTETEANLPNDAIPFVMTNRDKDAAAMCRLEIEAMKRHRCPDGLEVGSASEAEFNVARESFRRTL